MSTFYVLPARPALGDHLADCLQSLLPGLQWTSAARTRLTEWLIDAIVTREEVFLVPRDDLPPGESVEEALIHGYGAEAGDEVIEVRVLDIGTRTRRWRIGAVREAA